MVMVAGKSSVKLLETPVHRYGCGSIHLHFYGMAFLRYHAILHERDGPSQ
jgi:hypothetical protein